MKIIEAKQFPLSNGGFVYTHESAIEPGKVVVRVLKDSVDIGTQADTLFDGLQELASYFEELSADLAEKAYDVS